MTIDEANMLYQDLDEVMALTNDEEILRILDNTRLKITTILLNKRINSLSDKSKDNSRNLSAHNKRFN